ncbi:hypothetical protein CspHIS471_0504250 [Cutaneotrichosporon sp. HIS471]|nr:hypothetical protein CspHIS471_0504250 [Cutaneotrichosporon sp. HIS471]
MADFSKNIGSSKYKRMSPTWTAGDFEVITADSVKFLVPSLYLFYVSSLFRDSQIFQTDITSEIKYSVTFLDTEFETELVFDKFLDLVVHLPQGDFFSEFRQPTFHDLQLYRQLFTFMGKWECSPAIFGVLRNGLEKDAVKSDDHTMLVFAVGASVEDATLCAAAVNKTYCFVSSKFAPNEWPFWVWKYGPPSYLAALARAQRGLSVRNPSLKSQFQCELKQMKQLELEYQTRSE